MRHQILGPSQQERMQAARKKFLPCQITLPLDRHTVVPLEGFFVAQQTRHQEPKQRPKFAKVILHRRSGQAQAMPCLKSAGDDGGFGFWILDVLCLIKNRNMPLLREQLFLISGEEGVGRQH